MGGEVWARRGSVSDKSEVQVRSRGTEHVVTGATNKVTWGGLKN